MGIMSLFKAITLVVFISMWVALNTIITVVAVTYGKQVQPTVTVQIFINRMNSV